jgi:hypothetical protein
LINGGKVHLNSLSAQTTGQYFFDFGLSTYEMGIGWNNFTENNLITGNTISNIVDNNSKWRLDRDNQKLISLYMLDRCLFAKQNKSKYTLELLDCEENGFNLDKEEPTPLELLYCEENGLYELFII